MKNIRNKQVRVCFSESELLFLKSYLKNYNDILKKNYQKEKGLSDFIRDITLHYLIGENNFNSVFNVIKNNEKFSKRNLALLSEIAIETFGKDKANNIFLKIKNEEENNNKKDN